MFKYFEKIKKIYGLNVFLTAVVVTFIITLIDNYNLLTWIIDKLSYPAIICGLTIIIIKGCLLKIPKLFFLKTVNYIDYYCILAMIVSLLYSILLCLYADVLSFHFYKKICLIVISSFCLIILIFRIIYTKISNSKNNLYKKNIFNLQQLYNNEIPKEVNFILLDDKAASYDLLNRSRTITQISNTIRSCNPEAGFVMALKGEWGSGKTTIIKNVETKIKKDKITLSEDIIFIDDFEPWIYDDKKSLIMGFFDKIMNEINCGFSINEINVFTKKYLNTFSLNTNYFNVNMLDGDVDIEKIKTIINDYMECNNKKIVLILDNLERCSSKNIIFLLKNIHNIFDFKRIIYILSYDEKILKKNMKNNLDIDYTYLEKLIQLEFYVPKIDKSFVEDIIKVCLQNYFKRSKFQAIQSEQEMLIDVLIENIKDLRDFQRVINSTFYSSFNSMNYLNNVDMLFIEIIALKNLDLWNEININGKFYISEDRFIYNKYIYGAKKYNEETTKYFNDLFNSNKYNVLKFKKILCYLFPNVSRYLGSVNKDQIIEFIPEDTINYSNYDEKLSVLNKRIYNGKFFEVYFCKGDNDFTKIDIAIRSFIDFINSSSFSQEELYEEYINMEKILPGWVEKYTLETFQIQINKIKKNKLLTLLYAIYKSYYLVDDSPLFFQTDPSRRTLLIIVDIILELTDNDFNEFLNQIKNDYKNLYLISNITYCLNREKIQKNKISQKRFKQMTSLKEKIINKIKIEKINMYDKNNYNRNNMTILFKDEEYMKFVCKNLNLSNLMLFVMDCISVSISTLGIGYIFNLNYLNKFYGWPKIKKDLNKCADCQLKSFLLSAVKNSVKEDGETIFYTEDWTSLNELIRNHLNRK